jgi:hypothetical protein
MHDLTRDQLESIRASYEEYTELTRRKVNHYFIAIATKIDASVRAVRDCFPNVTPSLDKQAVLTQAWFAHLPSVAAAHGFVNRRHGLFCLTGSS